MNNRCLPFALLAALLFAPACQANDGSYSYTSTANAGAAMPVNNRAISMVSENVRIQIADLRYFKTRVGEDILGSFVAGGKVITKCSFVFHNDSPTEQSCLMGFPIKHPTDKTVYPNGNGQRSTTMLRDNFTYFECRVDGAETAFSYAEHQDNPSVPKVTNYDGVYVFPVTFKPLQTITIENLLVQDLDCGHYVTPSVAYILLSGLTWSSPIGEADISVEFVGLPPEIVRVLKSSYPVGTVTDNVYRWSFSDFVPNKDLHLEFDLAVSDKSGVGAALRKYRASGDYYRIFWLHDLVETRGALNYNEIRIPTDELRSLLFDTANYFYKQNDFYRANDMYMAAIASDATFRDLIRRVAKSRGIRDAIASSDTYGDWLAFMDHSLPFEDQYLVGLRQMPIPKQDPHKAPLYYLLYDLECTSSLLGSGMSRYLEFALVFGYPKSEFDRFRSDPDLDFLRKAQGDDLWKLVNSYK